MLKFCRYFTVLCWKLLSSFQWPYCIKNRLLSVPVHWASGWAVLDQPYSWSWTNESSSHQFCICLYLLHCSALSTGCSIYTYFSAHSSHLCHTFGWRTCCSLSFFPCNTASIACADGISAVELSVMNTIRTSLWPKRVQLLNLSLVQSQCPLMWTHKCVFLTSQPGLRVVPLYKWQVLESCLVNFLSPLFTPSSDIITCF